MDISKHSILKQGYEVMLAIEECGSSEKLSNAISLAGNLMDEIEKIVDELNSLKSSIEYWQRGTG